MGGFSFLSTEGAKLLGDGGSLVDEVDRVSDFFRFGFKYRLTVGGGITGESVVIRGLGRLE